MQNLPADERLNEITALIDESGYASVKQLSELFDVSEVTIRRDLQRLKDESRLRRTFGGGVSLRAKPSNSQASRSATAPSTLAGSLLDRADVLVAASLDPQSDRALMDRAAKKNIPVIGESLGTPGMKTVVAVDNYRAAFALGRWAGQYAEEYFDGRANVLDLSYSLSNTQERSQGFIAGVREVIRAADLVLSVNAQSRPQIACQLTKDALNVHPDINLVFAINDSTARGAIQACVELGAAPGSLLVMTFGLEGDTLKDALRSPLGHCRAGLAMFPEVVGPVCVEAAIGVWNGGPMDKRLVTPHVVLTGDTLEEFYARRDGHWEIRQDAVSSKLRVPVNIDPRTTKHGANLPKRIALVVPFGEHEWYKNLAACMRAHAESLGIELEIVDAARTLQHEIILRQRAIARTASGLVEDGDVILIDGGDITTLLAEELAERDNITVITNSVPVFQILQDRPQITLISTGGSLRRPSQTLIGPTTETALREMRADKLFLAATGISIGFGLSHTNFAEVAAKQAMLRAAREVILLADNTKFGQESVMQMAPATVLSRLITDNALPASTRLEFSKLGVQVIIAQT